MHAVTLFLFFLAAYAWQSLLVCVSQAQARRLTCLRTSLHVVVMRPKRLRPSYQRL